MCQIEKCVMGGVTLPVPVWAIALVLAVFAPFAARALAQAFDKRMRERTVRALGSSATKPVAARPTDSS